MAQTKTATDTKAGKRLARLPKKLRKRVNKLLKKARKGRKK
jgi:hypothetical protein